MSIEFLSFQCGTTITKRGTRGKSCWMYFFFAAIFRSVLVAEATWYKKERKNKNEEEEEEKGDGKRSLIKKNHIIMGMLFRMLYTNENEYDYSAAAKKCLIKCKILVFSGHFLLAYYFFLSTGFPPKIPSQNKCCSPIWKHLINFINKKGKIHPFLLLFVSINISKFRWFWWTDPAHRLMNYIHHDWNAVMNEKQIKNHHHQCQ